MPAWMPGLCDAWNKIFPCSCLLYTSLDEEHDLSYKQENPPRYHCREIAVWRARFHNCKVILASATPSLESYARAYKGVYRLIEMPKRIHQQLPEVEVVDMGECIRRGENLSLIHILQNRCGCMHRIHHSAAVRFC